MQKSLKIKAHAKINLGLNVLGRRPDGYHDLVSVMQPLSLSDTIILEPEVEGGWRFFCSEPSLSGGDNLVCRAAGLLSERAGGRRFLPGVRISLYKNIPVAAGLGGGSSDAAAVLQGLNCFWNLGMSLHALMEIGALIGSDVPFCLQGGTALVQGRGEKLEIMPALPFCWIVLALPMKTYLSTAEVYGGLKSEWLGRPPLEPLIRAIHEERGDLLHNWFDGGLTNTLEFAAISKQPGLQLLKDEFLDLGLSPALSGSGPSYFALCHNYISAREAARALQERGYRAYLCSSATSGTIIMKE